MKSVSGIWVPGLINQAYADICSAMNSPSGTNKFKATLKPLLKDGACPFVEVTFAAFPLKKSGSWKYVFNAGHTRFRRTGVWLNVSGGKNTAQPIWQMARRGEIRKEWKCSVVRLLLFVVHSNLMRIHARCYNPDCKFNKSEQKQRRRGFNSNRKSIPWLTKGIHTFTRPNMRAQCKRFNAQAKRHRANGK